VYGQYAKPQTPQQHAYQAYDETRTRLRAEAERTFAVEMAREKAGGCKNAQTTVDFNTCFGQSLDTAKANLNAYEQALRSLIALKAPGGSELANTGEAGPAQTPEQGAAEFDTMEKQWRSYLDTAGSAAFHQFDGGTGGPSFQTQVELMVIRNHLRELDTIYGEILRL
jgi:hypothetical protein